MRAFMVLGLLSVLLLASCQLGGQRNTGSGIALTVLNLHELRDVYFQYNGVANPTPNELEGSLNGQGDWIEAFRINTLVHNQGYADSLVALYVSGYDPNLFAVLPLGPFTINQGERRCFEDIFISSQNEWSIYAQCLTADDLAIGGGIASEGTGIDGARIDLYNANIGEYLDSAISWITDEETTLFQDLGVFSNVDLNCEYTSRDGDSGSQINCRLLGGLQNYFIQRSSRGSLLLALFGGKLRNCANGCVLVPSPRLPKQYLAGNNENFPGGEAQYVDFGVYLDRSRWPANLNDHDQLFQVTACYLYTTYATPFVCIDPVPGDVQPEVCRPGVIEITAPQTAPVRITHIEQSSTGPRVLFTIHVQNQLNGRVYHPGGSDICAPGAPSTVDRQLRDVAKVIDARVLGSLDALDCGDDTIHMRNGQGQITCFYEVPPNAMSRGAYQTTLNIEIGYLYRQQQTIAASLHRI